MGPRYDAHRDPRRYRQGMAPRRPPLLKRIRLGHWTALDWVVSAILGAWYITVWRDLAFMRGPRWLDAIVLAVAVVPAAMRRRWPRAVLAAVVLGQIFANVIGAPAQPALVVAFVIYLIPLRCPRPESLRLLAATLLATSAGYLVSGHLRHGGPTHNVDGPLLINALLICVVWMIGDAVRQQRLYSTGLRELQERTAREELAEARRAISDERLQIARELHDVVAHTMSVIAVQAGVANYVAADCPSEASRVLASIEETSRGALREMRALLGILRADSTEAQRTQPDGGRAPAPALADLHQLAARTAEAGVHVDLTILGEPLPLPAGLDLAAYRVIQEAITNVIRHAATNQCSVLVHYQTHALTVEIADSGKGPDDGMNAITGHGIIGMKERVAMYGGQLHAAPLAGHGFQVTARFPLAGST
jgi:signal transduction histidine kinase